MTNRQENKRSMYRALIAFFAENQSVYATFLPFLNAADRLKAVNDRINEQSEIQSTPIVGITEDKKQSRISLEETVIAVCSKINAYAAISKNNNLKSQTAYSFSSLRKQRDTLLLDIAKNILNIANQNAVNLIPYNVNSDLLTALQNKITDFNTILSHPRHKVVIRKGATQEINNLFKEADDIIKNELDLLIVNFTDTNPEFERNYKNARIIIDLGIRHRPESENKKDTSNTDNKKASKKTKTTANNSKKTNDTATPTPADTTKTPADTTQPTDTP